MKIYTKTGDKGSTSLFGGERVKKDHIRLEAYGCIDELNCFVGLLVSDTQDKDVKDFLVQIQNDLFNIGSHLACVEPAFKDKLPALPEKRIAKMEEQIDFHDTKLAPLKEFILPGGTSGSSLSQLCRSISRRTERQLVALDTESFVDPIVLQYVNRLSDYFFSLSRFLNHRAGEIEIKWNKDL